MTNPVPFERRLAMVEVDAAAALELARAHDRDIAELPVKVDANRQAINALGLQVAGRFEQIDRRFEQIDRRFERLERTVDAGFTEMRSKFEEVDKGLPRCASSSTRPPPGSLISPIFWSRASPTGTRPEWSWAAGPGGRLRRR